ncbi:MAG: hypothetical protein H7839_16775 [Magnetococcus sp. YQC-5]
MLMYVLNKLMACPDCIIVSSLVILGMGVAVLDEIKKWSSAIRILLGFLGVCVMLVFTVISISQDTWKIFFLLGCFLSFFVIQSNIRDTLAGISTFLYRIKNSIFWTTILYCLVVLFPTNTNLKFDLNSNIPVDMKLLIAIIALTFPAMITVWVKLAFDSVENIRKQKNEIDTDIKKQRSEISIEIKKEQINSIRLQLFISTFIDYENLKNDDIEDREVYKELLNLDNLVHFYRTNTPELIIPKLKALCKNNYISSSISSLGWIYIRELKEQYDEKEPELAKAASELLESKKPHE